MKTTGSLVQTRLRKDIFIVDTTISSALKTNYRAQREWIVAKIVACSAFQTSKPTDSVALNYVRGWGDGSVLSSDTQLPSKVKKLGTVHITVSMVLGQTETGCP